MHNYVQIIFDEANVTNSSCNEALQYRTDDLFKMVEIM